MPGVIKLMPLYTKELLKEYPEWLFLFGDNMRRTGRGGQAAACRDAANAVGVPTKWTPGRRTRDYFRDSDMDLVKPRIQAAFRMAADHLRRGGVVVLPMDGLGTGLAELPYRAPAIHRYVQRCVLHLKGIANAE